MKGTTGTFQPLSTVERIIPDFSYTVDRDQFVPVVPIAADWKAKKDKSTKGHKMSLTTYCRNCIIQSIDAPLRAGILTDRHRDSGAADKAPGITARPFPCSMMVSA